MRRACWPATCLLLGAAGLLAILTATSGPALARWIWRADQWPAAPWTLWTAPLVHFVLPHALGNALALAALAVLGRALAAPPRDALALLLAWPLGTLGLQHWPQVAGYWGLSGTVHAAAGVLAVRALAAPATRWLGLLLSGGLAVKLALERGWAVPVAFDSSWGFNVVSAAHLSGALAGACLALLLDGAARLWRGRRR
jgi:membrane associated rhomboid family serine protease